MNFTKIKYVIQLLSTLICMGY